MPQIQKPPTSPRTGPSAPSQHSKHKCVRFRVLSRLTREKDEHGLLCWMATGSDSRCCARRSVKVFSNTRLHAWYKGGRLRYPDTFGEGPVANLHVGFRQWRLVEMACPSRRAGDSQVWRSCSKVIRPANSTDQQSGPPPLNVYERSGAFL